MLLVDEQRVLTVRAKESWGERAKSFRERENSPGEQAITLGSAS